MRWWTKTRSVVAASSALVAQSVSAMRVIIHAARKTDGSFEELRLLDSNVMSER